VVLSERAQIEVVEAAALRFDGWSDDDDDEDDSGDADDDDDAA
jgi:hypothetical protein